MNPRTLRVLEYHKIRSMLAEYTSFSLGAERVRWLEPSASLETVERWQEETAQAVDLLNREPAVPLGDCRISPLKCGRRKLVRPLTPRNYCGSIIVSMGSVGWLTFCG